MTIVNKVLLKISTAFVSIIGSSILVFSIIYLLPGDPVLSMIDPSVATPEMVANLRKELGLDQPFYIQFSEYFMNVLQGDFGQSVVNSEPVLPKIVEHFPATLALTITSAVLSVVIGVTFGVLSAIYRNKWIDIIARVIGLFGISMPTFGRGFYLFLYFLSI